MCQTSVASHAPTLNVQSKGVGTGHLSFSSVWFTTIRGPSWDLTLWAHPGGRSPAPPLPCPEALPVRPRIRWSIEPAWPPCPPAPWAFPIHLDIPGEVVGAGVGGHESASPTVSSLSCLPMCQLATRGRSHHTAAHGSHDPAKQRQGAGRRGAPTVSPAC